VNSEKKNILTINGGSSSIKFAVYDMDDKLQMIFSGKIEKIGLPQTRMSFRDSRSEKKEETHFEQLNLQAAVSELTGLLDKKKLLNNIGAVGHRLVHGMELTEPQLITSALLEKLRQISSFDPDHLPGEMELIGACQEKLPEVPQIACFDTAFHTTIPRLARILPIPRKFDEQGIRKYGFHGLSYSFILEELKHLKEPAAKKGRIILAHLGSGASMAAVLDGRSVDTSMGFTPVGGLVMGTRTGDLDPGITGVLMNKEKMDAFAFNDFVNHRCGLLGVSETSSDMQELLKIEATDVRAREAIHLFCYQAKKWIGSFAAVLNGLDILVFTGGIGEHAAVVRERICAGLGFLGLAIDPGKNEENQKIISSSDSKVKVYVIPTNEERMLAQFVYEILKKKNL
jgi:acetate kinase